MSNETTRDELKPCRMPNIYTVLDRISFESEAKRIGILIDRVNGCELTTREALFGLLQKFYESILDTPPWTLRNSAEFESAIETAKAGSENDAEQCQRCGGRNPSWSAASPLWNAVMRGGSINGEPIFGDMVCAVCFMELAEEQGVASLFQLTARKVNVELETVTPSGRVWDEGKFLWQDPAIRPAEPPPDLPEGI